MDRRIPPTWLTHRLVFVAMWVLVLAASVATAYVALGLNRTADAFVINARGVVATPVGETTFLFTDTWTLADEGRTLLQVIHVETLQGPLDMTRAFDKQ